MIILYCMYIANINTIASLRNAINTQSLQPNHINCSRSTSVLLEVTTTQITIHLWTEQETETGGKTDDPIAALKLLKN